MSVDLDRILSRASRAYEIRTAQPEEVQELMLALQHLPATELITLGKLLIEQERTPDLVRWIDALCSMRREVVELGGELASSIPSLLDAKERELPGRKR